MNNESKRTLSMQAKYSVKQLEGRIRDGIWYKRCSKWADFLQTEPGIKSTLCKLDNFIDELDAYGTESEFAKEALGQVLKDKSL